MIASHLKFSYTTSVVLFSLLLVRAVLKTYYSFIRVHALVHFLLTVDASLDSLHIYLSLVSEAHIGVGR